MRILETFFGPFDLDDPETYSNLPQTTKELDKFMFCEIGKALVYMDYFHKDIFPKKISKNELKDCGYQQRLRVNELIKNFADNRRHNYDNVLWYQEQCFVFIMETENMC